MAKLVSTNPSKNYEFIGDVDIPTEAEIKGKVATARKAALGWKELGVVSRVKLLEKVYEAFEKRKDEIATLGSREMGMPIGYAKDGDLGDGLHYFRWYLDNAEKILTPETTFEDKSVKHVVYYEPYGVAAVISPWNFPFSQFVWGVIPQLIAGNVTVSKHSEETPLTGKLIEEIIVGCNLPEGVFSQVYGAGDVGDLLVHQDINLISFTGSVNVSKYLYKVAAEKFIHVLIESGGSAPGIVYSDADIPSTIEGVYNQRFGNCGQMCDGLKRLIVHESIFDMVVDGLKKKLELLRVGDPMDALTELGPMVARRQLELLESQVADAVDKGAKILTGGKRPVGLEGAYYLPTLLTNVTREMRVWKEEVFGPVLPVVSFKTDEEAIGIANDTQYGLGAYIYSKDIARARRVASKLESGMVNINNTNYVCPWNPFGGYKSSGIGREHGHAGLRELCQIKVVAFPMK